MRKIKTVLVLGALVSGILFLFITVPVASGAEEWEDADLEWYYDNLDDTERKKIRQAFDYCIPREQVIEGLMKGYAIPLATEIGSNIVGYDDSVQPRAYNLSKALALLTDVFGKEYSTAEDPSDTYTDVPYFKMTLISPTTNVARTQWASMTNFALNNIGIDTTLKWWNWNIIMPRLFLDPITDPLGADYEHGGYDAYFIGFGASVNPDYSGEFFETQFAPAGDNSQYIENAEVTEILNRSITELELADRITALEEFQAWFYEWVPKSIIRQGKDLFGVDINLQGLDTYRFGRYSWASNVTITGQTDTLTVNSAGDLVDFNVYMSNSWYDSIWQQNVFLPLLMFRSEYDLANVVPCLAKSWSSSADKLVWTVNLKEGILWDDGTEVTADDVVFSYQSGFYEASSFSGTAIDRFGANNTDAIKKISKYVVEFTLKNFYPFMETSTLQWNIIQKAQMSLIDQTDWKTDGTNTGSTAMIGCGPYKFDSYSVTGGVKLVPNTYYDEDNFNNATYPGGAIVQPNAQFPIVLEKVMKEATPAVTGLSVGTYDIIEPNTGIFALVDASTGELKGKEATTKIISALEFGWQELAYNHYDPRWGLNPHDPREMYPGDYEGAPFDLTSVFFGILMLASIQIIRNRKKKN